MIYPSLPDLKAEFSHAYVRAVAHAAGFFVQEASRMWDSDGVDLTLLSRSPEGTVRSPRLDIQLKATAVSVDGDPFPFDLSMKNYDELRSESLQVPRILVVVAVPAMMSEWASATEEALLLRHCGYWKSLRGEGPRENVSTARIKIHRTDCFHVTQVANIMDRIRAGGLP